MYFLPTSVNYKEACPFTSRVSNGYTQTQLCNVWHFLITHTIAARELCSSNMLWQSHTLGVAPPLAVWAFNPDSIRGVYTWSVNCHMAVVLLWVTSIICDALRNRSCYIHLDIRMYATNSEHVPHPYTAIRRMLNVCICIQYSIRTVPDTYRTRGKMW